MLLLLLFIFFMVEKGETDMLQQEVHHELVWHCNGRGIESLVWIGRGS